MAFVLETGEGLPNSNAFISVAYASQYWEDRGRDIDLYDDEAREHAIIRATQYISESHRFRGVRRRPRNATEGFQALEFPRIDLFDHENYWVPYDAIPREVEQATAEAAWQELIEPHSLQPVYASHDRVKSEQIGPIKIEYDVTKKTADSARPVIVLIRDLIGQYLLGAYANPLSGQAIRG